MIKDHTRSGKYQLYNWGSGYGVLLNENNSTTPTSGYGTSSSGAAASRTTNKTSCMWIKVPAGYYLYKAHLGWLGSFSKDSNGQYNESAFTLTMGTAASSTTRVYYSAGGSWLGDQSGWWDGFAVIARNEATINYNGNGNTGGSTSSTKVYYANSSYLASNGFTKKGHTFSHWSNSYYGGSGTTTKTYNSGSYISWSDLANFVGSYCSNGTTFYANWTANNYTIYFDKQLPSGNSGTDSVTATFGSSMPSATMPTRTGYKFLGYYDKASGGTQYYTASGASARAWDKDSDTTLYAHWQAKTYTVTLNTNAASGITNSGTTSVTATYDSAMPAITKPVRTGFAFQGYYDTSAATGGTQYYTSTGASARKWDKTKATTLYARWVDNESPVVSRATVARKDDNSFYAYAYVTDNVGVSRVQFPTWTDLNGQDDIQASWQTNSAASGTAGSWTVGGQTYNYRYLVNKSDHKNEVGPYIIHIYAYDAVGNAGMGVATSGFTIAQTVTFDKQNGTGGTTSVLATKGAAMPTATMPTRAGWNFLGYYTQPNSGGTQYYTASGASARSYDRNSTLTLYARWQEKTWTDDSSYYSSSLNGSGTESSPYIISSSKDLARLALDSQTNSFTGKYFKQTSNIDLNAHLWLAIASNVAFSGIYDGNYYEISNIRIESASRYTGLFGYTNGTIKNVRLNNATISANAAIGAIAGCGSNANIMNCIVDSCILNSTGTEAGGLVGYGNATISSCMVKNSTIKSSNAAGGISGASGSIVKDCSVLNCTISANTAGIIVGNNSGIKSSYGYGSVNGTTVKLMYGGMDDFGGFSYNTNLNGGYPVAQGLFAIGGITGSEAVYIYLNVNLGFTPA